MVDAKKLFVVYSLPIFLLAWGSYVFIDLAVAEYFYQYQGTAVWRFFKELTELGEGIYWIVPAGLLYLFFRFVPVPQFRQATWFDRNQSEILRVYGFVALTALLSGLVVNILKIIFARYRPIEYFELQNYGMSWFEQGFRVASFPSGHSATALSVAVALMLLLPTYRVLIISVGLLIMFSRVVLTVHYVSDILIGGYIGAMTSVLLYQKYFRPKK